jgi:hypothetical protein
VTAELIRAVDHDIAPGVQPDMTEHGFATDVRPAPDRRMTGWAGSGASSYATVTPGRNQWSSLVTLDTVVTPDTPEQTNGRPP